MNIDNQRILFIAQYAAPYEGNFILSLSSLEAELKSHHTIVAYAFPKAVLLQPWYDHFRQNHTCYTISDPADRSAKQLLEIYVDFCPTLIHTHFDGYDLASKRACDAYKRQFKREIIQVWHLHNQLSYVSNPLKHIYQFFCFIRHYKVNASCANIIAVSAEVLRFVSYFKNLFMGTPFCKAQVIPNGIDETRLATLCSGTEDGIFRFLAFGGRNIQKRVDLLCDAAVLLEEKIGKNKIEVLLTNGTDTMDVLQQKYQNHWPSFLKILPQDDNIGDLYASVNCFVSTSVAETFSYAICEASIFGLPVIQSDIEGTLWNASNPSTWVFKSEDVNDLATQMYSLMRMPKEELAQKCRLTQEHNRNKYTISSWCKNVIEFYRTIEIAQK